MTTAITPTHLRLLHHARAGRLLRVFGGVIIDEADGGRRVVTAAAQPLEGHLIRLGPGGRRYQLTVAGRKTLAEHKAAAGAR
jgi:hypothetical protein